MGMGILHSCIIGPQQTLVPSCAVRGWSPLYVADEQGSPHYPVPWLPFSAIPVRMSCDPGTAISGALPRNTGDSSRWNVRMRRFIPADYEDIRKRVYGIGSEEDRETFSGRDQP